MTIEQVIRVVFDGNAYTRGVAEAAAVSGRFDANVNSVTTSLLAMSASAGRAGAAQALAATSGNAFLAALQRQAQTLQQQSTVIGKTEADLLRLKAAELGVAQQAGATITALEQQAQAITRLGAGARALDSIRSAAAFKGEREAVEAGIAVDVRAGRAKEELIAQIERETAALTRLTGAQRGAASGSLVDRVQAAAADDPAFAARAQPAIQNLGAAQAARDQQVFIAALERTANAAGRTRAELLALEAAEKGVSAQAAPLIARIASVDKQFQSFSKTGRLTALELQQVGFQVNDFFVQLASGGNPIIALVQQGSQLSGTFGGIGNAVRALTSLITPLGVAIAGVGATVGVFAIGAVGAEKWARSLSDLQVALEATGRAGQVTSAQLAQTIEALSEAPGITRAAATGIVTELARAGQIRGELLTGVAQVVPDFARAIGKDAADAATTLAQAFRDPVEGAKTLEQALPRLSSATRLLVRDLINQGDTLGAQRTLLDEIARATAGLAERGVTPLQRATNDLGNSWEALMRSLRDSEGASVALRGLTGLVGGIQAAIDKADELRRKGIAPGLGSFTGVGAVFQGARAVGELLNPTPEPGPRQRAAGVVTNEAGRPVTSLVAAAAATTDTIEQQTKAALKLGEGFTSTGRQIDELVVRQKALRTAIQANVDAGRGDTPQVRELRANLVGVGERIESLRKKGQDGDPDRDIKRTTALAIESARRAADATKATVEASNEALRAEYEEGSVDLATYYTRRRELAVQAAAAEEQRIDTVVAALERERTVAKTPETREVAESKLTDAVEQQVKASAEAERAQSRIRREEQRDQFQTGQRLIEQEAELAQLRGDDARATAIRNQLAVVEFDRLNARAGGPQERVVDFAAQLQQQTRFQQAQIETGRINERLANEEERIELRRRTGYLTENQALVALGAARARVISQLEEQLAIQEEVFASTRNPQLLENLERTRLELEKLKGALDPLKEKFDALFKGAAGGALADLMNGRFGEVKPEDIERRLAEVRAEFDRKENRILKDPELRGADRTAALKKLDSERSKAEERAREQREPIGKQIGDALSQFGKQIVEQMNATAAQEIAGTVFGPGGIFGGAGGFLARSFGGAAASVDKLAAGVNPATVALDQFTLSLNAAASAAGQQPTGGLDSSAFRFGEKPMVLSGQPALNWEGQSVFGGALLGQVQQASSQDPLRKAASDATGLSNALVDTRTNAERFSDLLGPAAMAIAGMGKSGVAAAVALRLLPSIIQQMSSSSGGGGIFGSILKAFGLGGGGDVIPWDLGFSAGGFTGPGSKYQPAGIVHAEEFVNRREVVAQPGALPFLERFNEVGMQAVDETFIQRIRASAGDPTQILPNMRAKAAAAARVPGFADGGYVGSAPSYADGGYVGSRGNYFPESSRREEPAETRQETRAQGMQVHIYNNNGSKVETRERETSDGTVLEIFVDQVQAKLMERTARGGGLDPLMSGRYGLNPGSNARR
jgi:hypothetical protein